MANIVITAETEARLASSAATRRLGRLNVEQDGDAIDVYELVDDVSDDWPELKRRYEAAWDAYDRHDLPTATRLLAKILVDHPGDRPSLQLLGQVSRDEQQRRRFGAPHNRE